MAKTISYEELKELVEKRVAHFKKQAAAHYSIASSIEVETGADDSRAEGNYLAAEDYEDLAADFEEALDKMHDSAVFDNCKKFAVIRKSESPMTHYLFTSYNLAGQVVRLVDVATYLP